MKKIPANLKFSVITPSFNQGEFIETTIKSVLEQNYSNFEHVVIDGGSRDDTLSILRKFSHLSFTSEKDTGQSEAVNKGLRQASGEIIAWINSDDWYEPGIFHSVANYFSDNPEKMIVMGDCNLVNASGEIFNRIINHERGYEELRRYWVGCSIPTQPAIFFRKCLIDEFGYLDESLHYAMDYDLWLRFSKKFRFHHLKQIAANYRFHTKAKGGDQDWTKFEPEWKIVYQRRVTFFEKIVDRISRLASN